MKANRIKAFWKLAFLKLKTGLNKRLLVREFLKAFKDAFPHTISILLGYLLMGMT
ncbi:azaleucine resistance protein AzlC, partial [Helicobacter pylori]